jgi:hypothetical protein
MRILVGSSSGEEKEEQTMSSNKTLGGGIFSTVLGKEEV